MSFFGREGESVPPEFTGLFEFVPEDEEVVYWLRGDDTNFYHYCKYINSETCWSCPPFSWIFPVFNLFNMPCIYADFRNNSSKILIMTNQTVILGAIEKPYSCCCFQPDVASENADVYSWRNIKYVGSKQEFNGMNKDSSSPCSCLADSFFNEPRDILMVAKKKNDRAPRGLWIDFVPFRAMRLDEVRQLRKDVLSAGYVRPKGIRLVELGTVTPSKLSGDDGSDDDSLTDNRLRMSISPSPSRSPSRDDESRKAAAESSAHFRTVRGNSTGSDNRDNESNRVDMCESAEMDELDDGDDGDEEPEGEYQRPSRDASPSDGLDVQDLADASNPDSECKRSEEDGGD